MVSGVHAPLGPHIAVFNPPAISNSGSVHEYMSSSHSRKILADDTSAEFDVPLAGTAGGGSQTKKSIKLTDEKYSTSTLSSNATANKHRSKLKKILYLQLITEQ